jgi:lipopolysaccharide transport system permease protein
MLGSGSLALAWMVLTPILLLLVYSAVFGYIFKARVPEDLDVSFVSWLAVGLWPWYAFSESISRGSQSIKNNSALISKVPMTRAVLPFSAQTAAFLFHLAGFVIVLLALLLSGTELNLLAIPYVALLLLFLYLFSLGLAFLTSALQVFFHDLQLVLPTLFTFWFFLTPIIYPASLVPDHLQFLFLFNPIALWVQEIRAALYGGQLFPSIDFLPIVASTIISCVLGKLVFDRLSVHFEDFL